MVSWDYDMHCNDISHLCIISWARKEPVELGLVTSSCSVWQTLMLLDRAIFHTSPFDQFISLFIQSNKFLSSNKGKRIPWHWLLCSAHTNKPINLALSSLSKHTLHSLWATAGQYRLSSIKDKHTHTHTQACSIARIMGRKPLNSEWKHAMATQLQSAHNHTDTIRETMWTNF